MWCAGAELRVLSVFGMRIVMYIMTLVYLCTCVRTHSDLEACVRVEHVLFANDRLARGQQASTRLKEAKKTNSEIILS